MRALGIVVFVVTLSACVTERTAVEQGRALFDDPDLSISSMNNASCSLCHATTTADTRLLPGAHLGGVTERPSYFGGRETDLRRAVNYCLQRFMRSPSRETLTAEDPRGRALLEYLSSLEGSEESQPWTIVQTIETLPAGDAARGAELYARGCESCHGERANGHGRISALVPRIPDETIEEHEEHALDVTLQKIRWGQFRYTGGDMPAFSPEVLSDQDLADVVVYLGYDVSQTH